jgi:DNA polymerase I
MLVTRDTIAGDRLRFCYVQERADLARVAQFIRAKTVLGIDTESTHHNCYRAGWQLRSVQVGTDRTSFVVPARFKKFIAWLMRQEHVRWIGHNGPHDIRSIDAHLGYDTGVVCAGETYIPAHHLDSRKQEDGGIGHGLKELACHYIDPAAGKWEKALKDEFKKIEIPIPGEVYKSGPRKGQQKVRKARIDEGWGLIDPTNPRYIAYAASDPVLTYRLWRYFQPVVKANYALYRFDHAVQLAADKLQRRAMPLDVRYTKRLSAEFLRVANDYKAWAEHFGCDNINSGQQVAATLERLGVRLWERTPSGQFKTEGRILRGLLGSSDDRVEQFVHCVLGAKQLLKRRESYTEQMLAEMDIHGRVHPSINVLAARSARMSVSGPPLQQLPTKDRGDELVDEQS